MRRSYRRVSKLMALILRHRPEEFGVELDELGFCPLSSLVRALRKRFPWVDERVVRAIVEGDEKGRYEMKGDRIRARYGHSVPVVLDQRPVRPPELLYHGTSSSALPSILEEGLKPMGRRFVHLSASIEDALSVGRRRDPKPVILEVKAGEAWRRGIPFYRPSERIYLAPHIPPALLRPLQNQL